MALFNDTWLDTLLAKNDIVSVVSSYVHLKAKGQRMWGLCPFHSEKTPSFSVVPDKQMFYCFGCHMGGGVVQFIMQAEKLSYIEAVKFLAQRAGMELPGDVDDEQLQRERARKQRLYAACKEAALFFHRRLMSEEGKPARAYLVSRGIDANIVTRFGLGYAPDSWDALKNDLQRQGYTEDELLAAGLLMKSNNSGRVYDAFRKRVIFPIISTTGRVVGFGARSMDQTLPKYINTGDTLIYNKRNNLYALQMMKGRKVADLVMVEGYMDVISLHAAGVDNAVASLGTALTVQQARLIKRYVPTVYIAYDGDSAGQNATLRGLDILSGEGLQVRVIVLPDEMDPDDFVRKYGKEAFEKLKDEALTLNAFKLERMAKDYDITNDNERDAFAMSACKFIAGLQPVEQERYYQRLARMTGISLETLQEQGAAHRGQGEKEPPRFRSARKTDLPAQAPETPNTERMAAELSLLRVMCQSAEAAATAMALAQTEVFTVPAHRMLAEQLLQAFAQDPSPDFTRLTANMEPEAAALMADLSMENPPQGDLEQIVSDCLKRMKRADIREDIQRLQKKADDRSIGIDEKLMLVQQIQELQEQLRDS